MLEKILFYTFGCGAVLTALGMITRRNAVYSAVYLVGCFCCVAGLYVLLNAQFLAAVQVIVYAGAIMVLFIFVIMLLRSDSPAEGTETISFQRIFGFVFSLILLFQIGFIMKAVVLTAPAAEYTTEKIASIGNTELVGQLLFTKYLYPFEVVSILLLAAIIGAVVLAKKKI
ncbi:MAG: NADH-quinone oxidoreductase subunit J [bacterium]